jgi:hypothetical protein
MQDTRQDTFLDTFQDTFRVACGETIQDIFPDVLQDILQDAITMQTDIKMWLINHVMGNNNNLINNKDNKAKDIDVHQ